MKEIQVNIKNALTVISKADVDALQPAVADALSKLHNGTGAGNDFLGWLDLATRTPQALMDDIVETAQKLREECDVVVCVGIGGSYLGAKAVIEALSDSFAAYSTQGPKVVFAGQNIGEDYLYDLQNFLKGKRFGIIVISKSGTTTEPAIAFRLLREQLENSVGKERAAQLTVAITDARRGALRQLATEEGFKTYVIEDNVGGRFSVLSPVGLLPIAVAGFDIKALMEGAAQMQSNTVNANATNLAATYAATRNALYQAGKKIEILVNYNPRSTSSPNGGNSSMAKAKGKTTKASSPLP